LQLTSLLICTLGFSNLFGTQILLTFGDERKLLISTILGALSNIALNLILIPVMAQNGAALASVISETIVTLTAYYYAKKRVTIRFDLGFYLPTVVSTIIMGGAIYVVMQLYIGDIEKMLFSTLLGGVVFLLINVFM
ncbi:lipid II flippase MurJ, partial [Streptococcus pneumoniae]